MSSLIIIVALFVLLWVVMIRPQRNRQQAQKQLIASVAPGDEVLTVGGLYGIVQEVEEDDDAVVVEIAEGIHVRVARRAIAGVEKADSAEVDVDESVDSDLPEAEGSSALDTEEEKPAEGRRRMFAGRGRR